MYNPGFNVGKTIFVGANVAMSSPRHREKRAMSEKTFLSSILVSFAQEGGV